MEENTVPPGVPIPSTLGLTTTSSPAPHSPGVVDESRGGGVLGEGAVGARVELAAIDPVVVEDQDRDTEAVPAQGLHLDSDVREAQGQCGREEGSNQTGESLHCILESGVMATGRGS